MEESKKFVYLFTTSNAKQDVNQIVFVTELDGLVGVYIHLESSLLS